VTDINPLADQSLQECERQQKRSRIQEMLTDHLVHRPGPLDLVGLKILKVDVEQQDAASPEQPDSGNYSCACLSAASCRQIVKVQMVMQKRRFRCLTFSVY
jgi:hypothetical protein